GESWFFAAPCGEPGGDQVLYRAGQCLAADRVEGGGGAAVCAGDDRVAVYPGEVVGERGGGKQVERRAGMYLAGQEAAEARRRDPFHERLESRGRHRERRCGGGDVDHAVAVLVSEG